MRYIVFIGSALLLAACGSSPPTAIAQPSLPTVPPAQCAQQMRSWLAKDDGSGASVRHDIIETVLTAEDYKKKSPTSVDAAGDVGSITGLAPRLSSVPDPPSCADNVGYWSFFMDDVGNMVGDWNDSSDSKGGMNSVISDMQDILNDFANLNAEIKQSAPGAQINVHQQ